MMFKTTPEQQSRLFEIADQMEKVGLECLFIFKAFMLAAIDQGVYDLMVLWFEEKDLIERQEIINDIQKSIDDYAYVWRSQ